MNNKTKIASIALFLSALIILVSFGGQKAEWKGKIEIEDGVKVIKNPREPLYGEIKLELEEDLRIGNEIDENYKFYRVRGVAVDKQGNIYVSEMSNYRIQKFDKNGEYLQTIGRQGQGPGEFELPLKVLINDTTGSIFVSDLHNIEYFDRNGNFIKSICPIHFPVDFIVDSDDNLYAKLSYITEAGQFRDFSKISKDGDILMNFAHQPYYNIKQKKARNGGYSQIPSAFDLDLHISKINSKRFIYGFSLNYELNVIDSNGQLLYKIIKDEKGEKFSAKEKHLFEKSIFFYKLPPNKPFFHMIFTDSKGRIYIQTNLARGDTITEKEVDIFSMDGIYLYKTKLPLHTYVIKNGFLYALVLDEDIGTERIVRYRIKNWKQIQTGI